MTHLNRLRLNPVIKWVSSNLSSKCPKSQEYRHTFRCYNLLYFRFLGSVALEVEVNESGRRFSPSMKREARSVLFDYLRYTRSFVFSDADYMSKNSPHFLKKLVKNVGYETDIRRSMVRFLRYHPINEFELFFESIGLEPSEYSPLLPRNMMFLSDEEGLLDNYHVLCEYGIRRDKLGKIYKEAREVFRYDHGILKSKLKAFEELGMSKDVIVRVLSCNPYALFDGMSEHFFELVRKLNGLGCENSWVEHRLVETTTYNWGQISLLLHLLYDLGCNDEEIRRLVSRHPGLLFDHSGRLTISLIGFLLKFGSVKTDICSLFLGFPQVKVQKFVWNLRRGYSVLWGIEMDTVIIGRIIREHFTWMGTCSLKQTGSILTNLNTGKKHVCQIIMANPMVLKNWTLGAKIEPVLESQEVRSRRKKIQFLTSIGFVENSKEIEKFLKLFRGKGDELPERFNCLVKAGLTEIDVVQMIKVAPHILNQSVEALEAKISVLVNDLGYPISRVKTFPGVMSCKVERIKLRCAMYRWLVDQKAVCFTLSLSSIIGSTTSLFFNRYVSLHPRGPELWQTLGAKLECKLESHKVRTQRDKIQFLTSTGFIENSKEIEKALKVFRGKGSELRERFNCLVKAGFTEVDVVQMIKVAPHILNQSVEALEAKINVLVNDLGYPISSLKTSPGVVLYKVERMKIRCAMYRWLVDQKVVCSTLSPSSIIGSSTSVFFDRYVSLHPKGPEIWQTYKQTFDST